MTNAELADSLRRIAPEIVGEAMLRLQPLSDREAPGDDAEDDDEFPRMQPWPKKET